MIDMPAFSRPDSQRARELRGQMTDAEIRLWMRLRGNQMVGHHFRRQVPIGPYVADFVCIKAHLVVEVDGSQHQTDISRDEERSAWLRARGFRVLRFWNNDVLQQTDSVLEKVRLTLIEGPTLPSPASGEK
jgi:very-short-patch-repair endonuclease